jgi:acyl phosphate:glycerol-3-phosphate acyltransferase
MNMHFALAVLISYLLGSVSGSLLIGLLKGVDIRKAGSGNAGATNALRTQGKGFALATVLIDCAKGALAVLVVSKLANGVTYAPHACAFAAVLGHCFPIYFGFRGGKGAGTALGAFVFLVPLTAAFAFLLWALCLVLSGYVGLSTIVAVLGACVSIYWIEHAHGVPALLSISCFLLVALMHHSNLRRLLQGKEFRFDRARLLHRWLGR